MADWAAFQEDAAAGGDLKSQAGRTTLHVPDFDLLLTLSTQMEWFQDGWRLKLSVKEAHFGGEDQTDDYEGLSLQFVCVPETVAFSTFGMDAFGEDDIDTRASHESDCLEPDDHASVAAAFQQMVGRDFPLDGIEAILALTVVPDVAFITGSEKGDSRVNQYGFEAGGSSVRITAKVTDDRVASLAIHAEAEGAILDSALVNAYGSRLPSP